MNNIKMLKDILKKLTKLKHLQLDMSDNNL